MKTNDVNKKELPKKPEPSECRHITESGPPAFPIVGAIVIVFVLLFMLGNC